MIKYKFIPLIAILLLSLSSYATTYYTIDNGNGPEWSLDEVTPCKCESLGDESGDILVIRDNISLSSRTVSGNLIIEDNTLSLNGSHFFDEANISIFKNGILSITGFA